MKLHIKHFPTQVDLRLQNNNKYCMNLLGQNQSFKYNNVLNRKTTPLQTRGGKTTSSRFFGGSAEISQSKGGETSKKLLR